MLKNVKPSFLNKATHIFVYIPVLILLMSKSINSVIILISIALIGLVAIQVYWISNAVEVKEQRFSQAVHEALIGVVQRFERYEALKRINGSFDISSINDVGVGEQMIIQQGGNGSEVTIHIQNGQVNDNNSGSLQKAFINKKRMIDEILNQMVGIPASDPSERMSHSVLDSLIRLELYNRGITTKFDFNIFDPLQNFLYETSKKRAERLLKSPYKINLLPNDFFQRSHFVMLHFPNQSGFILQTMWGLLAISSIFILVIIFAFYSTISTILKQKKLSEIKNDFINNMTHELKTPISTISLACEALNDPDMSNSGQSTSKYVNMIKGENNRLGKLVERVLQSAVIEKGELVLNKEEINMHRVIEEAVSSISLQVNNKSGEIIQGLGATNFIVSGDKMHLTNVIYNLLDNANKYCNHTPEINISTENLPGKLVIKVSDNGIGINKENQKKIFEKLYRVPTGNLHNVKGFGLGLSYVKAVVDLHEGIIIVESELNKGSRFTIELPVNTNF